MYDSHFSAHQNKKKYYRIYNIHCAVPNCGRIQVKDRWLFRFPEDKSIAKRWLTAIGRPDLRPCGLNAVCSDHFNRDEMLRVHASGRGKLRKHAIPTLFLQADSRAARFDPDLSVQTIPDTRPDEWFLADDDGDIDSTPAVCKTSPNRDCEMRRHHEDDDLHFSAHQTKHSLRICCAVPNCGRCRAKNRWLFPFPEDKSIAKRWLTAIGCPDLRPSAQDAVCSDHFNRDEMIRTNAFGRGKLRKHVIPTLFLQADNPATRYDPDLSVRTIPDTRPEEWFLAHSADDPSSAAHGNDDGDIDSTPAFCETSPKRDGGIKRHHDSSAPAALCRFCNSSILEGMFVDLRTQTAGAVKARDMIQQHFAIDSNTLHKYLRHICWKCYTTVDSFHAIFLTMRIFEFVDVEAPPTAAAPIKPDPKDTAQRPATPPQTIDVQDLPETVVATTATPDNHQSDDESMTTDEQVEYLAEEEPHSIDNSNNSNSAIDPAPATECNGWQTPRENSALIRSPTSSNNCEANNSTSSPGKQKPVLVVDPAATTMTRSSTGVVTIVKRRSKCSWCNETFATKLDFDHHVHLVHSVAPYLCHRCARTFDSESAYHKHINYLCTENPADAPRRPCPICNAQLKHDFALKQHMASQHGEKFPCKVCGKKYTRVAMLMHKRVHEHKYACSLCPKTFSYQRAFREHMAQHAGVDLYRCEFCPMTFRYNLTYYAHRRSVHNQ